MEINESLLTMNLDYYSSSPSYLIDGVLTLLGKKDRKGVL